MPSAERRGDFASGDPAPGWGAGRFRFIRCRVCI